PEKRSSRYVWSAAELQAKNEGWQIGLRQCIRPSVESPTPGHDGYPLALVPINWTASKRPLPRSGFESVGETHCHLCFPPADLAGTLFSQTGILSGHRKNGSAIAFV